jgi:hypothetical protein
MKVAVSHNPDSRVVVSVNGEETDPLSFEGTIRNSRKTSSLSVWRGVRLQEGENRLVAVQYGDDDNEMATIKRTVYFAGRPVRAEVIQELSRLVADGKTPPMVALRLTDVNGKAARPGLVGQFSVDPPYRSLQSQVARGLDPGDSQAKDGQYLIGEDGVALLSLEPTTRSGEAKLNVAMRGEDREVLVWLTAQRQEWILVGLAEGTVGYNTVSGNMQSLDDAGGEEDTYTDGRTAFFAKGKVKGEYILTMQYDSAGPHGAAGDGLHGTIDPDTYYTLYGDSAEQDFTGTQPNRITRRRPRKNCT